METTYAHYDTCDSACQAAAPVNWRAVFFSAALVTQIDTERAGQMQERMVSFRLTAPDVSRLNHLAKVTGRNRSEVLRRLILLADNPAAVELLGKPHTESEATHG